MFKVRFLWLPFILALVLAVGNFLAGRSSRDLTAGDLPSLLPQQDEMPPSLRNHNQGLEWWGREEADRIRQFGFVAGVSTSYLAANNTECSPWCGVGSSIQLYKDSTGASQSFNDAIRALNFSCVAINAYTGVIIIRDLGDESVGVKCLKAGFESTTYVWRSKNIILMFVVTASPGMIDENDARYLADKMQSRVR